MRVPQIQAETFNGPLTYDTPEEARGVGTPGLGEATAGEGAGGAGGAGSVNKPVHPGRVGNCSVGLLQRMNIPLWREVP